MSDKIPVAVVGLNFGRHVIEELVSGSGQKNFRLVAVCDLDEKKAASVALEYGIKGFSSLDELLAESGIPAIGLYTGPAGRAGLLRKIINAGKDVMTTKPFEVDCNAALAVLKEAERLGRIIHLNSPSPLWPGDLKQVRAWQQSYDLGRPVACQMSVWARYNEVDQGSWMDDPVRCPVAPIFRLGIYLINDLVRLFGEAEQVQVLSSRLFTGRPTPDNAQLGIRFRNGVIANIFASFCVEDGDHYMNSMALQHDRGTIYRNTGSYRQQEDRELSELSLVMGSGSVPRRVIESGVVADRSGLYQWHAFAAAIRGEKLEDPVSPEDIVAGLRVIEAMGIASREGGCAQVLPVTAGYQV